MFKALGGLGDMAKMMKAATEMQSRLTETQEELARTVIVGEAGAGLVKARATARGDVMGLDIDPTILIPSEKEVIEDLIVAAIRDAQLRAKAHSEEEMAKLATGLGLPAGMKIPT